MTLATYKAGQTPFPEFSVVVMLDDMQILYYDSVTWSVLHHTHSDSKYYDEEQSDAGVVFREMYNSMKDQADYLKVHLNHTNGVHVQQRLAGCELLNYDKPGPVHFSDMKMPWMITWEVKRLKVKFMFENVYHPICIKVLRRKELKPRVRLMKKTLTDSQGLQIFYPCHINLTLFRDGQSVDDDQITGEILPNGDGTYQMRKSLVISEEKNVAECDPGSFSPGVSKLRPVD
uniref:Uncharacterized protein n=1 Tax=Sinocyclocheilus rhinocerous TaxID=307959 RepID=A0A673H1Y2_9TELE